MDSMGALLRHSVDFVNVAGQWLKGREEAVAVHKERHLVVFKSSIWQTDSVSMGWGIKGDVDPDGKSRIPRHGISTWVLIKENNQWLILAVQCQYKRNRSLYE